MPGEGRVGGPAQPAQRVVDPAGHPVQRQRAGLRRGELQRQRKSVEAVADGDDVRDAGMVEDEVGSGRSRPLEEEAGAVRCLEVASLGRGCRGRQRGNSPEHLARQSERLAAGYQDMDVRAARDELLDERGERSDHVLGVVEDHERRPVSADECPEVGDEIAAGPWRQPGGVGDHVGQVCGVAELAELDPPRASWVGRCGPGCELEREAGLAASAGAGERHQPMCPQEGRHRREFVTTTDERAERCGQCRRPPRTLTAPGELRPPRRPVQRLASSDRTVQRHELRRRLGADLLDEAASVDLEGAQRIGATPSGHQSPKLQELGPVAERMVRQVGLEGGEGPGCLAGVEEQRDEILDRASAELGEPGRFGFRPGLVSVLGEGIAGPQTERRLDRRPGLDLRRCSGAGELFLELGRIEAQVCELVSGRGGEEVVGADHEPEPADARPERVRREPEVVLEHGGAHDGTGVDGKPGQQPSLRLTRDPDRPASVVEHAERAEHPKLHRSFALPRSPYEVRPSCNRGGVGWAAIRHPPVIAPGGPPMPYLFTRSVQLAGGNLLDSMAWSVKITEKVNAIAETPVLLWSSVLSPDLGRLTWSTAVADLSTLTTMDDKLMADPGYLDLVEEGTRFTGGAATDALVRFIHVDRDGVDTAKFNTVVRAVLAPGAFVDGTVLGVEIAERAKAITGRPTSFVAAQSGVYGEVGWVALYDSIDQVQAAGEALAADADFAQLLDDKASKAYIAGVSTQVISRRVA